jgi:hypothetical protein
MFSALLEQEHYGLRFTDFVQGYYPDGHPTMPGMAYLKLKGLLITKGNKIKGSAPTLFDSRNSRRLVHNPNDQACTVCMSCFADLRTQPDQEFIYCYNANCVLLDQYTSLPDCRGFQTNPVRRIGKNSIGKLCMKLNQKSQIKNGHLFRNHCWHELGLGTIANNPNINMTKQMDFSRHSNTSSHIAYIRAGHNSDFSFQKAIYGAPMPKKKEIACEDKGYGNKSGKNGENKAAQGQGNS